MNRSTLTLALAGLATLPLGLFGCGGGGGSSTAPPSGQTRIVFVSDKDQSGNKEIYSYIVNANTVPTPGILNSASRHTSTPVTWQDQAPSVTSFTSANPDTIVFQSDRPNTITPGGGQDALWKISITGNLATQLTFPAAGINDSSPVWSHDGKKVAFARGVVGGRDIYVLDTTTSVLTQITNSLSDDITPEWSPDDSRLVFSSNRVTGGTDFNIYTASSTALEGSVSPALTTNTGPDEKPQFSPDGTRILYVGRATAAAAGIVYSMPISGATSGLVQHTSGTTDDGWPRYSPNGQYIIFHRLLGNRQIIYKLTSDGPGIGETQANTSTLVVTGFVQPAWANS